MKNTRGSAITSFERYRWSNDRVSDGSVAISCSTNAPPDFPKKTTSNLVVLILKLSYLDLYVFGSAINFVLFTIELNLKTVETSCT